MITIVIAVIGIGVLIGYGLIADLANRLKASEDREVINAGILTVLMEKVEILERKNNGN